LVPIGTNAWHQLVPRLQPKVYHCKNRNYCFFIEIFLKWNCFGRSHFSGDLQWRPASYLQKRFDNVSPKDFTLGFYHILKSRTKKNTTFIHSWKAPFWVKGLITSGRNFHQHELAVNTNCHYRKFNRKIRSSKWAKA